MRNKILVLADDEKTARVCSLDIQERFKGEKVVVASGSFRALGAKPDRDVFEVYVVVPGYRRLAECDRKTMLYDKAPVRRIAMLPSQAEMRIASLVVHRFSAVESMEAGGQKGPTLRREVKEASPRYVRRFTVRETQVLLLIASGYKNREIMEQLGIAPSTLSTYVRNLFNKTGLETRCQLALFAMNKKLVSP